MKMRLATHLLAAATTVLTPQLYGQDGDQPPAEAVGQPVRLLSLGVWSHQIWDAAAAGDSQGAMRLLDLLPHDETHPDVVDLRESIDLLRKNIDKREAERQARMAEASDELDEILAADSPDLTEALRLAVELYMISPDPDSLLGTRRFAELVSASETAARRAERDGDWLECYELFVRLNALYDREQTYKPDVQRQLRRLGMLRLYAPQRLWELRNEARVADGDEPLPPYNPVGDDYRVKLDGIRADMVTHSLTQASVRHVDGVTMRAMLLDGIDALRTLALTSDLRESFPGMADDEKRAQLLAYLDEERRQIEAIEGRVPRQYHVALLRRIVEYNARTVSIPETAVFHEFGNGAMSATVALNDDYSAIVWPNEMERWRRMAGSFVGVGVKIQLDEMFNLQVVTPLGNTPAQRAGIRAGDLITKVDGVSTVGFSLDQAVDLITGPRGTEVELTISRETEDGETEELDFTVRRDEIPLTSVKGWLRTGPGEDDWDWYIDRERRIGYMRITGFQDTTTAEFRRAAASLLDDGLNGLIVDVRFNPGGFLNRAVEVANAFIAGGLIVSTENSEGRTDDREFARARDAMLTDVPVVVLINEGTASGAEILSGAIQDYAHSGDTTAMIVGQRSWGKGSVLSVWEPERGVWALKLATQYYKLPNGRLIHRRPGDGDWGVAPDLAVEILPEQISESLTIREEADVLHGRDDPSPARDPMDLITEGHDLQLETALVLLQARAMEKSEARIAIKN